MTVLERAFAVSIKRELLPMGLKCTVKSSLLECRLLLIRERMQKLIIFIHTKANDRCNWQSRNIISITLTSSPVMYSFYDKNIFSQSSSSFWQPCSKSFEWEVLKSVWLLFFTVKSLIGREYFFMGNCEFFHRFSTKYSLNNNIMNFLKKSVCRIFLSRISLRASSTSMFPCYTEKKYKLRNTFK